MAVNLKKGDKISLKKDDGKKLEHFCVGCNWGAIPTKIFFGLLSNVKDVDLDLSCVMLNAKGEIIDHIYSPLYKKEFLKAYGMPKGKLTSQDAALHHSGDDLQGDTGGDDGLDNEIITVDLTKISPEIYQIVFFLNNCGHEDFSQIPYASIRMYEGSPQHVEKTFAAYNVSAVSAFKGMTALIMGKLYRTETDWNFTAIGNAFPDKNICETILRIQKDNK